MKEQTPSMFKCIVCVAAIGLMFISPFFGIMLFILVD